MTTLHSIQFKKFHIKDHCDYDDNQNKYSEHTGYFHEK